GKENAGKENAGKENAGKEYADKEANGAGHQGKHDHDGNEERGKRVGCDPNELIAAITNANEQGGGALSLAENCTYILTTEQDGNGLPQIFQPVTIYGNGSTITRAAAADPFRIFEVENGGDLKLRDLTISHGRSDAEEDGDGGGIYVNAAGRLDLDCVTLDTNSTDSQDYDGGAIYNEGVTNIHRSTLSNNNAEDGSALYNDEGKVTITASKITNNAADSDDGYGALYNYYGSTSVSKSEISRNTAYYGGGVYHDYGITEIDKSVLKYNWATYEGGAVYVGGESFYLSKSVVEYNTADSGGGLYLYYPSVVEDSKIRENVATDGHGGGIYIGDDVSIRRSEITRNRAPGDGYTAGGIYNDSSYTTILTDVDVTENYSDEAPGGYNNTGSTVLTYGDVNIVDNDPTNCTPSASPVPGCFG
ncbi:right-handed parallel beta-helix repeat-containing protein, partial [Streptomyces sp. NPDC054840]